jgi:hypothetical protein
MLPVAGRFRAGSRFPQYFTSAKLTFARAVVAATDIPFCLPLFYFPPVP